MKQFNFVDSYTNHFVSFVILGNNISLCETTISLRCSVCHTAPVSTSTVGQNTQQDTIRESEQWEENQLNTDTNDTVESHTALHLHASQSETWRLWCLREKKKKKNLLSWRRYSDQPFWSALRPAGGDLLMRRRPLTTSSSYWFLLVTYANRILQFWNWRSMDEGWGSFEMRDVKQGGGLLCLQVLNIQSI